MLRRTFIPTLASASLAQSRRPNIIMLLADDLGIGDLGCYGGTDVETPALDQLARSGVRFRNFYSAGAVCSPTRASIVTGKYPLRFGIRSHFRDGEEHLPRGVVTLPSLLKEQGYRTAHVGKWHLGGLNRKHMENRAASIPGPREHGFDRYFCMYEELQTRAPLVKGRKLYHEGWKAMARDEKPANTPERHLTDLETDEALRYISEFHSESKPFFLNLWFDTPHMPYEAAPEEIIAKYRGRAGGDNLLYRSMVAHLDHSVGRVMRKLLELGIAGNTMIVFSSDNGPAAQGSVLSYKGRKADLHEGGVRVPGIFAWTGRVKPAVTEAFGHSTDILPTLLDAAGIAMPRDYRPDGVSQWAHLNGKPAAARGPVFWQYDLSETSWQVGDGPVPYTKPKPYATEIARDGKWKLLARDGVPVELFDVESDPHETANVSEAQPEVTARLTKALRAWLAEPRLSPLSD